jgi:hypothetical protein
LRNQSVAYIFATEQLLMLAKDLNKMRVEVFKTNVADPERAKWLVDQIERNFANCKVNFDLDDCDRILRVVFNEKIQTHLLIDLLNDAGCMAEVLPDTIQTM